MAYDTASATNADIAEKGKVYHPSVNSCSMTIPVSALWRKFGNDVVLYGSTAALPNFPIIGVRIDTINGTSVAGNCAI